ncbi:hypothetical protein KKG46_00310 [Patescibacteria group bacterium]|nr:hypothetical protein [Patescibacteria group bacterium]
MQDRGRMEMIEAAVEWWNREVELFFFGDTGEMLLENVAFNGFDRVVFFALIRSYVPVPEDAEQEFADLLQNRKDGLYKEVWENFCLHYNLNSQTARDNKALWNKFVKIQAEARAAAKIIHSLVVCNMDVIDSGRPTPLVDVPFDLIQSQSRESQRPTKQEELESTDAWERYMTELSAREMASSKSSGLWSVFARNDEVKSRPAMVPPPRSVPAPPPRLPTNTGLSVIKIVKKNPADDTPEIEINFDDD